jgi:hypothetical protein
MQDNEHKVFFVSDFHNSMQKHTAGKENKIDLLILIQPLLPVVFLD